MKALLIAALFAAPLAQAQTVWKLATGYRAESFHTENIVRFADDVARATAGQLRIDVYPNNALARLGQIPEAVREGRAQAGETIMTSLVREIPLAGADAIPFVVNSYESAQRMWDLQRPLVEARMAELGLKVLYAVPWPPQGLYSSVPIRSAADFRGTRMRTYNEATVRIAEMLQATPVDVPMVDVNEALAAGRLDSMITSAVTGVENRVWGRIRYYYEINAWFPKNIVFVSSAAFERLSLAARQAVVEAARDAQRRGWEASRQVAVDSTNELRAHGVKIDRIAPNFEADLRRMGERFSREWVRSVGNEANSLFIPFYIH